MPSSYLWVFTVIYQIHSPYYDIISICHLAHGNATFVVYCFCEAVENILNDIYQMPFNLNSLILFSIRGVEQLSYDLEMITQTRAAFGWLNLARNTQNKASGLRPKSSSFLAFLRYYSLFSILIDQSN